MILPSLRSPNGLRKLCGRTFGVLRASALPQRGSRNGEGPRGGATSTRLQSRRRRVRRMSVQDAGQQQNVGNIVRAAGVRYRDRS